MPVQRAAKGTKRSAGLAEQPAKRVRVTLGTGTNTQSLELADTQQSSSIISAPKLPQRQSPRKALADVASQATEQHPSESQLLLDVVPNEGSNTANGNREVDSSFDERLLDNFDGIDWCGLSRFCKPLRSQKRQKSWIYNHGYRVALRSNTDEIHFICKFCHQRRSHDGILKVTQSTTSAITHLKQPKAGHNFTKSGLQSSVPNVT